MDFFEDYWDMVKFVFDYITSPFLLIVSVLAGVGVFLSPMLVVDSYRDLPGYLMIGIPIVAIIAGFVVGKAVLHLSKKYVGKWFVVLMNLVTAAALLGWLVWEYAIRSSAAQHFGNGAPWR